LLRRFPLLTLAQGVLVLCNISRSHLLYNQTPRFLWGFCFTYPNKQSFNFSLAILLEVCMKQLITYTNIFARLFTGKTVARLQNIGEKQYQLAVAAIEENVTDKETADIPKKMRPNRPPTEWDIALMQEQYRYYRYTDVVARRTKVV
jgi:hypothetical protein